MTPNGLSKKLVTQQYNHWDEPVGQRLLVISTPLSLIYVRLHGLFCFI